jgi:tryptophanyl-tRNA synthetase
VLTKAVRVPGLDGRKMSKTYGNGLYLRDTPEQILQKCTREMLSDTARVRKSDPGNPEVCNVFTFHKLFSSAETVQMVAQECPRAGIGCFDCKKRLAEAITARVEPLRLKIEDWTRSCRQAPIARGSRPRPPWPKCARPCSFRRLDAAEIAPCRGRWGGVRNFGLPFPGLPLD